MNKKLQALGTKGRRISNKAVRNGANIVAENMKKEVPVSDKNHLHIRDNIKVSGVSRKEGHPIIKVGPGKETAWRAKFLEYGTVKMPPQPFISNSGEASSNEVKEAIKNEMKRGLGL